MLRFTEVTAIGSDDISDRDARRAGYASADEVRSAQRPGAGKVLYRISFRLDGPDPRVRLRTEQHLDDATLAALSERLARLDRRESGPWTLAHLTLIADNPGVLAATLAKRLGRERDPFKRDIRKLKDLGLTESLEVGYRISPRGRAVLQHLSPK
jgi:hypothetical protein